MRFGAAIPLAGLLLSADTYAFCGTYVGGAGSTLTNTSSRIAIARDGTATTLTMFNDVQADTGQFGIVIPVPVSLDEDNLRLADPALLDRIDAYSSPRSVAYTCDDLYRTDHPPIAQTARSEPFADDHGGAHTGDTGASFSSGSSSSGCGDWGGSWADTGDREWFEDDDDDDDTGWDRVDTANDVTVEDEFDLGEYTAFVLQATGSEGLVAWLDANGFVTDPGTAGLFQQYIDGGSHFLALRVNLDRAPSEGAWLSPLQIGYRSEGWSLPIRTGARNSSGVQDLVLYVVTSPFDGAVGIANYGEWEGPQDECMVPPGLSSSLAEHYEAEWAAGTGLWPGAEGASGFAWTTEYSFGTGKCDPCGPDGGLSVQDVDALGFGDTTYGWHFTRLHARYTADAVDEDLTLYPTGILEPRQERFVEHAWELESRIPTCGGPPADPGDCYTAEYWERRAQARADGATVDAIAYDDDYRFCALTSGRATALLLPVLAVWRRRRR